MRRVRNRFFLLPLLLALACVQLFAQANSTVTGIVTDQSGAVVAGASISLTDPATGAVINGSEIRKSPKTVLKNPAGIVIVLDADDNEPDLPGNRNNCPDPTNNHGKKGWNWGFSDGHAEWVTASKTAYMITNGWMYSGHDCVAQ